MNWGLFGTLFVSSATLWGLGVGIGLGVKPELQHKWLYQMQCLGNASYSKILSFLHARFLDFFGKIYRADPKGQSSLAKSINRLLWTFILIASVTALVCSAAYGLIGWVGQLESVLAMMLAAALFMTLAIIFYVNKNKTSVKGLRLRRNPWLKIVVFLSVVVVALAVVTVLFEWSYPCELKSLSGDESALSSCAKQGKILIAHCRILPSITFSLGLVSTGIIFGTFCGVLTGLLVGNTEGAWAGLATGIMAGFLTGSVGYHTIVGWPAFKLANTLLYICLFLLSASFIVAYVRSQRTEISKLQNSFFMAVCQFKAPVAIGTSIISISLGTFLVFVNAGSVFDKFHEAMLSNQVVYLVLNVVADSFSIMETHWVLCKFKSIRNPVWVLLLLLLDLLASALIYLSIPLLTRSYEVLPAIVFSGDKPWIGIFFWSTFSTSFIFYLFVGFWVIVTILEPFRRLIGLGEKHIFDRPACITAFVGFILTTVIIAVICLFY